MNFLLIPFSFLYLLIISLRNFFYNRHIFREHKFNARVVSVGNITWGGTGKTPVVAFIGELLVKQGKKPAVLTRGYGKDEEALLSGLAPKIPIIVGKDRIKGGQEAITNHLVNTILLDDGFQYRRLKRDVDIVCIDSTDPFGNGCLIPAGSMREGLNSLKRADVLLLTRVDLAEDNKALKGLEDKLKKVNPHALIVKAIHKPKYFYRLSDNKIVEIEQLKNGDLVLVSAIGNPYSFEKTFLKLGLRFKKHFAFRDHYWYKEKDLKKIGNYCAKHNIGTIVTTEKDAIKLRAPYQNRRFGTGRASSIEHRASNFIVLHIELQIIDNEQGFYNRLFGICNS